MGNPRKPIAITGATGFIGRALCARLRGQGRQVKALVRDPAKAHDLAEMGVELVAGDLANRPALDLLLQDASTLVHCAGSVRGNSQEAFNQVNVEGMGKLLNAAQSTSPAPRFVLLSSITAREPDLSWYASSKRAGEDLLRAATSLNSIILRPPAVYGPGDKEMLPLFKLMKRGIALVPGSASSRVSLIHVDDLVAAIIGCIEARHLSSSTFTFTPTDPKEQGYDWREMAAIAEQLWQRKVHLVSPPAALLNAVAQCNLMLSRTFGYDPMLTPAKLRELRHADWVASAEDLSEAIGWKPSIDLETGLAELAKTAL